MLKKPRTRMNKYTDRELIQFLHTFKEETGRTPTMSDFTNNPLYPTATTYHRRFGSWNSALEKAGLEKNMHFYEASDLLVEFKNDNKGELSNLTIQSYTSTLADLYDFLKSKKKDWNDLNKDDIKEYFMHLKEYGCFSSKTAKQTRPNFPKALKSKARYISAFLTWLEDWCLREEIEPIIKSAEIARIKKVFRNKNIVPPVPESTRRGLMEEEIEQIRSVIDNPIMRNIFDLGLNFGLRAFEYGMITMDMVLGSPEERRPRLNGNEPIPRFERENYIEVKGKGNKTRYIVVTEEMKVMIKKQLLLRKLHRVKHDGFFFSVGKIETSKLEDWKVHILYAELREKSGVDFTAHVLRYTMASQFLRKDVKENMIKQRLGHGGSVTQLYEREQIRARYEVIQEKVGII